MKVRYYFYMLMFVASAGCDYIMSAEPEMQFTNKDFYVVNESQETLGNIHVFCYEYFGDEKVMVAERLIRDVNMKPGQVIWVTPGVQTYYEVCLLLMSKQGNEIYKKIIVTPH